MRVEVLDKDQIEFEINGGSKAVAMHALSFVLKWTLAGLCFRVGFTVLFYGGAGFADLIR